MTDLVPLVIAAHGTRDVKGVEQTRAFVDQVRAALPGVHVELGFVELAQPSVPEAVETAVAHIPDDVPAEDPELVVLPLMLNTGGHVNSDIPEFIEAGRAGHRVSYGGPLLPDPRVRDVLEARITETLDPIEGESWRADDTSLVLVGRGALATRANAEHYRLTRYVSEELGFASAFPAYIQVVRPSVPEALSSAAATGTKQILVGTNFLFHGRLRTWLAEQVAAWQQSHPDVTVRISEVLGPSPLIAQVCADRYKEQLGRLGEGEGAPVYLSGLRLEGRTVLVVGAGHVAERRIPRLLEAGAVVRVVAPNAGIKVARMAKQGLVDWQQRGFAIEDMNDAWFVLASANDPEVNAKVAAEAERQHIFCVRADKSDGGSAYTPATQQAGGLTVAVVGHRNPQRSVSVRDELLKALQV